MADGKDELWRNFPKTAVELERVFATEKDCIGFWMETRWGGEPACARCASNRDRVEREGRRFECAECGHQTSLTSGTVLAGTHKPFKVWFRAVFEISTRRNGISAKELQRILGFGSYETAWTWLHKIRASLVRRDRELLGDDVEIVEAFVGGKRLGKSMVLVATETDGRLRLAHALTNDEETLKAFADAAVATDAVVTSDGHAGYNANSLGERAHEAIVQTNAERAVADTLQCAHWSVSMLKRRLMGTHVGAVKARHRQAYLDEFAFRWNRRKTNGVGRISARTIEMLVSNPARTMRAIVDGARPYPLFVPVT